VAAAAVVVLVLRLRRLIKSDIFRVLEFEIVMFCFFFFFCLKFDCLNDGSVLV
jgi:hypothetical protein